MNRNRLLYYEYIFGIAIITVVGFTVLANLQYNGKMGLPGILLIPTCLLKPMCMKNSFMKKISYFHFVLPGIIRWLEWFWYFIKYSSGDCTLLYCRYGYSWTWHNSKTIPFISYFLRRDRFAGLQKAFGRRLLSPMTNYEVAEMVTKITLLKTHARILIIGSILAK